MNLIYRLPERVSERQCVHYILGGIRTEIARMARTANIQSVDDLIEYVKLNYGPNDKLEIRSIPRFHSAPAENHKPRYSNPKVDMIDEYDHELSFEEEVSDYEVNEVTNQRNTKFVPKSPVVPDNAGANNECVCKHKNKMNSSSANRSNTNRDTNWRATCQYCRGSHLYRDCPLPLEERDIHCFLCQSRQHIASDCPARKPKHGNQIRLLSNQMERKIMTRRVALLLTNK